MSALDQMNALLRAGTDAGHACCAMYQRTGAKVWCANCDARDEQLRQPCRPRPGPVAR